MKSVPYKAYISRFPKKRATELKEKLVYKHLLENSANFRVPKAVWFSFLTPPESSSQKLLEKTEQHIWKLKKAMLDGFAHPERFESGTITNRATTAVVTAALLEILFDLEERKVLLPKDAYKQWVRIAERFGLWQIRYYLEDAIFKNFDPENYRLFRSVVQRKMKTDAYLISDIRSILRQTLYTAGIQEFEIRNRQKNVYGVYDKMHKKGLNINDIYDIHGFRILTKTKKDCYRAHDALDRLWPTYRDRYKDYIKKPKENGYQSIHTVLRCLRNTPIEFQIRSFEMDVIAESGHANHADYKYTLLKSTFPS